ncbi:hypothetical protein [Streptomyces sp. JH34]|uniref:hypothetical protein n=1 Tax=Streptomyces sp. JH34 TaxID=2793633 RepID=UPI0023F9F2C1|nr:hypothetical protein [Streptomyces sp. JH34]MDF6017325.1 hypothetical protein [Streptomyces sp. JH34]
MDNGNRDPQPGGISIGTMHGSAVAQGSHAKAVNVTQSTADASELLAAVTALRDHLSVLGDLDAQLAAAQGEITATGEITAGRLEWLRDRIAIGATAATGLATAGQAAEQLARLIAGQV